MFDKIIYCSREDSDPSKINKVLKSNRDGGKLIHLRSHNHSNHRRSEGLSRVLQLLKDKKLEIILDPSSPHPFTEDGVESAYKLYTSGGGRGGIVVEVTLWFRKFLVLMHLERWKLIDCGRYSDNQYSVYGAVILLYFLECYNSSYVEVYMYVRQLSMQDDLFASLNRIIMGFILHR